MAAAGTWNMTLGLMPAHRARFPSVMPMCLMVCICTAKTPQEHETPAQVTVLWDLFVSSCMRLDCTARLNGYTRSSLPHSDTSNISAWQQKHARKQTCRGCG